MLTASISPVDTSPDPTELATTPSTSADPFTSRHSRLREVQDKSSIVPVPSTSTPIIESETETSLKVADPWMFNAVFALLMLTLVSVALPPILMITPVHIPIVDVWFPESLERVDRRSESVAVKVPLMVIEYSAALTMVPGLRLSVTPCST